MKMAVPGIQSHITPQTQDMTVRRAGLPLPVAVFIMGLVLPLFFFVGPVRLSVYTIVLLLLFFPGLYYLFTGRAGRLRLPDFCVIGICVWSSLSFSVVHGLVPMIEAIGILWVETLGAYLLGRCFIRTPEAFYAMVRMLFRLALVILPFAIYEALTDKNLLLALLGKIGPTVTDHWMDPRLGFNRVQGPFPHAIHFGVFFLSLTGVIYYALGYGRRWAVRVMQMLSVAFLGAMSLSSGPLVAVMSQLNLILWDGVLKSVRHRWHVLAGLSALGFVIVDLISTRTPFHVVAQYLSFSPHTAYNRIRIWQFGTDNIFSNPLFGIGNNEWVRPSWMSDSVDMFWILPAMRHGIPVWILWLTLFFSVFLAVAYRRNLTERVGWYRTGYVVTMFGFFMVGWTVHFWLTTYVFFLFMLGSGVWILDWQESEELPASTPVTNGAKPGAFRFTRFTRPAVSEPDMPSPLFSRTSVSSLQGSGLANGYEPVDAWRGTGARFFTSRHGPA